MLDLVIRGGWTILPDGPRHADVGVGGGVIRAIAEPGVLSAGRVVDADGLFVLPGGIDPHVHVNTRVGAWTTRDDFRTATVPAALGGTTTILEFAIPRDGETAAGAIARRIEEAAGAAVVDHGFHA